MPRNIIKILEENFSDMKAIQDNYNPERIERSSMPFCRVIDERHPIIKKLGIDSGKIADLRIAESFK